MRGGRRTGTPAWPSCRPRRLRSPRGGRSPPQPGRRCVGSAARRTRTALAAIATGVAHSDAAELDAAPVVARLVTRDDEVRTRGPDAAPSVRGRDATRHATLWDVGSDAVAAVRGRDRALEVVAP